MFCGVGDSCTLENVPVECVSAPLILVAISKAASRTILNLCGESLDVLREVHSPNRLPVGVKKHESSVGILRVLERLNQVRVVPLSLINLGGSNKLELLEHDRLVVCIEDNISLCV